MNFICFVRCCVRCRWFLCCCWCRCVRCRWFLCCCWCHMSLSSLICLFLFFFCLRLCFLFCLVCVALGVIIFPIFVRCCVWCRMILGFLLCLFLFFFCLRVCFLFLPCGQ